MVNFDANLLGGISPVSNVMQPTAMPFATQQPTEAKAVKPFGESLVELLSTANKDLIQAGEDSKLLVTGKIDNIHQAQISGTKAELMLKLTTTIVNKLTQATTSLFQMQI